MVNIWMKRIVVGVMALSMVVTLLPTTASAQQAGTTATEQIEGTGGNQNNTTLEKQEEQEEQATENTQPSTGDTDVEDQNGQVDVSGNVSGEPSVQAQENGQEEVAATAAAMGALITYSGHEQTYGNLEAVSDGAVLGRTGFAKRLEALTVNKGPYLEGIEGDINYRVHGQTYGTQGWKVSGQEAGSHGQAKRLEAIQIYLSGELANQYDIYYRAHIQSYGWMNWIKGTDKDTAQWAGSTGLAKRMEAFQIVLVKKGSSVPAVDPANATNLSYVSAADKGSVNYFGHQQTYGNLDYVADGESLGITGQAKRLEGLTVQKGQSIKFIDGDIHYRVHGQTYGDQAWKSSGQFSGTTGQAKRIEAIQMSLSGELAAQYDIYYRVHSQKFGWMNWAKGGSVKNDTTAQWAGTSDYAFRMESIQIVLVAKGSTPSATSPANATSASYSDPSNGGSVAYAGYQEGTELASVKDGATLGETGDSKKMTGMKITYQGNTVAGNISYRAYMQNAGWNSWTTGGGLAGLSTNDKRMEAIQMNLTGNAAECYDIWYRVYVSEFGGWLGWAKNGQPAGTSDYALPIEGIQIKLVGKMSAVPGANSNYFHQCKKTVYIDAGHGGQDSGATNGTRYEKNDTLRIALAVQKKLQDKGVTVYMARTGDDPSYTGTASLYNRPKQANGLSAGFYVSLHRDSAGSTATGFTIYTHNASDASNNLSTHWPDKTSGSTILSRNISEQMKSVGQFKNRGIVYGSAGSNTSKDLIVNKYSNMPSCLIELGFISNNSDNAIFDKYLDQYATAIANGIIYSM